MIVSTDPWRDLAASVLLQAVRDANDGNGILPARKWLESEDARLYFEVVGIDQRAAMTKIKRGMEIGKVRKHE